MRGTLSPGLYTIPLYAQPFISVWVELYSREQGSFSHLKQQSPGFCTGFSQLTGGHSKSQQSISPCYKKLECIKEFNTC